MPRSKSFAVKAKVETCEYMPVYPSYPSMEDLLPVAQQESEDEDDIVLPPVVGRPFSSPPPEDPSREGFPTPLSAHAAVCEVPPSPTMKNILGFFYSDDEEEEENNEDDEMREDESSDAEDEVERAAEVPVPLVSKPATPATPMKVGRLIGADLIPEPFPKRARVLSAHRRRPGKFYVLKRKIVLVRKFRRF